MTEILEQEALDDEEDERERLEEEEQKRKREEQKRQEDEDKALYAQFVKPRASVIAS